MHFYRKTPLLLLVTALAAFSQGAPRRPQNGPPGDQAKKPEAAKPEANPAEEKTAVTHHKITVHGKTIEYTATAARLPIRDEEGHVEAEMFYVAYTVDGEPNRPLTFAFNGGPGAATVWETRNRRISPYAREELKYTCSNA